MRLKSALRHFRSHRLIDRERKRERKRRESGEEGERGGEKENRGR